MRRVILIITAPACIAMSFSVGTFAAEDYVKQSRSGYCHYQTSKFYERTQRYTKYATLRECLSADGNMPPNDEERKPNVKYSRSHICHDTTSPYYGQTRRFVAFETMEDCERHGGRSVL